MAKNSFQIATLLERLWAKTREGSIKWDQLSDNASYETRLGDFSISVRGSPVGGLLNQGVRLKVSRLDGKLVAAASTGSSSSISELLDGFVPLTAESASILQQLYGFLTDRSQDMDELLRLLR